MAPATTGVQVYDLGADASTPILVVVHPNLGPAGPASALGDSVFAPRATGVIAADGCLSA